MWFVKETAHRQLTRIEFEKFEMPVFCFSISVDENEKEI